MAIHVIFISQSKYYNIQPFLLDGNSISEVVSSKLCHQITLGFFSKDQWRSCCVFCYLEQIDGSFLQEESSSLTWHLRFEKSCKKGRWEIIWLQPLYINLLYKLTIILSFINLKRKMMYRRDFLTGIGTVFQTLFQIHSYSGSFAISLHMNWCEVEII